MKVLYQRPKSLVIPVCPKCGFELIEDGKDYYCANCKKNLSEILRH